LEADFETQIRDYKRQLEN